MVYDVNLVPVPSALSTMVLGTSLDDVLGGYAGNDTLIGGLGNDLFFEGVGIWDGPSSGAMTYGVLYDFGLGSDTIDGGGGFDIVSYLGSNQTRLVDLKAGTISDSTLVDTLVSVEGIVLGEGDDRVIGNRGGYAVALGEGNDMLVGIAGVSDYYGGLGTDTIDLRGYVEASTIRFDLFSAAVGAVQNVYIDEFENVYGVINSANEIYGNDSANYFRGGNLGDVLAGLAGNDRLNGGAGNDSLFGGGDNDILWGGSGDDSLNGGGGNDRVYASIGNDRISAGPNNDLVNGQAGNDTIFGGAGQDSLYGGDGNDVIDDRYYRSVISAGNGDDRVLFDYGIVYGGAGNDRITQINDLGATIYGGDGNDTIEAGVAVGRDGAFYGGSGTDTFIATGGSFGIQTHRTGFVATFVDGFEVIRAADGAIFQVIVDIQGQILNFQNAGRVDAGVFSDSNLVILTKGDDTATVTGSGNDINMGGGDNSARIMGYDNIVTTGGGADIVEIQSYTGRVTTGGGDDQVVSYYGGAPSSLVIGVGAGNDSVIVNGFAKVGLGDGDDFVRVDGGAGGILWGGAGADTFSFVWTDTDNSTTIADFNPLEDKLNVWQVISLSDVTSINQVGNDATLFFDNPNYSDPSIGFLVTLSNLLVSDLHDGIFV